MTTEQDPTAIPKTDGEVDPLIGTVVAGRYRLLERLGSGGMGAVYRGEHVTLRKRVAVKFLHEELLSNAEVVARFRREAEIASTLEHPNVAAVIDFGTLPNGAFYLAMEFVDGRSLRQVIESDGKLPPVRVVRIVRQIASALARAHRDGIVHRDLKPENVIVVDRDGERDLVKVIDFGIARRSQVTGPQLTTFGAVFGTPHYMSPEQAMGQGAEAPADQYALGVIAFELLVAKRPFDADDASDLLRMHVGAPIPEITTLDPQLPVAVNAPLARMLAKRPAERFESIDAAVEALSAALSTAVSPVAPPGPAATDARAWSSAVSTTGATMQLADAEERRRKRVLASALGACLAVATIFALATREGASPVTAGSTPQSRTAGSAPTDTRPVEQRLAELQTRPEIVQAFAQLRAGSAAAARAPLLERLRQNPRDGLVAYLLGVMYLRSREPGSALVQFTTALTSEPGLAVDPMIATSSVAALRDPSTANDAEALLRGPLANSPSALQALTDESLNGSSRRGRTAALAIVESHVDALTALDAARVRLRAARTCEDLQAALEALRNTGDGIASDEVSAVRSGQCGLLRIGADCRSCF